MTCEERELDLLLHLHGALSPGRQLLTTLHLRRCARCRARQEQWQRVAGQMAAAVRGPLLPPWSPKPTRPVFSVPLFVILLAAFLLLAAGLAFSMNHRHRPVPVGSCRPDLPNDQCR